MTSRASVMGLLALMVAAVGASRAQARAGGRSVVSLLSPAHGSAFAFGGPGHLLTTKRAVGGRWSVKLVTAGGRTEIAAVVPTNDSRVVQLRGPLRLAALRGGGVLRAPSVISVASGPRSGSRVEVGKVLSVPNRATSLAAGAGFEGGPILDARGRVIGIATSRRGRIAAFPVRGLRAISTKPTPVSPSGSSPSLVAVVAIVFAFGVGVGAARVAIRMRVAQRLAERSNRRRQPRSPLAGPIGGSSAEHDTGVHVVLRPRPPDEPVPDVRLRSRKAERPDATTDRRRETHEPSSGEASGETD
jgi:hypothetical protein